MLKAVLAEYPALIAACVAFKSMRYSSQKRSCLGVSFAIIPHLRLYIGKARPPAEDIG